MTRIGWWFAGLVVVALAAMALITRFVDAPPPVPAPAAPPATAGLLDVPVSGVTRAAIVDTWGQARSEGRAHHGTDIPAAAGTPVLAAADGRIEKLFASRLGGTTIYERSPDRRWTYYYAHLSGYAPGLAEGQAVRRGQAIGYVGDTGDAGAGNYHLHFGLTRAAPDQHWWQGEDVNAYPYLAGRAAGR